MSKITLFRKLKLGFLFFLILTFFISFGQIFAQKQFDTKGTDFWLAYLPNYHNNYNSNYSKLRFGDSLYIFIVAEESTKGVIEYTNRNGQSFSTNFQINDPKDIYTFKVSYWDFEVFGYNLSGDIENSTYVKNQSEKVGRNSFHVMTDNEVTVYAHSQAVTTSDAFLVLPTDVLGKEYLVLTYKSDGAGYNNYRNDFVETESSTPSQFLIVASEDNTKVTINPSQPTHVNGLTRHTITLNQGEVYLVQAKINTNSKFTDLSGSEVLSDKPIAIFAGQQRATIPVEISSLTSRDCVIEEILSVDKWGKNAFVIPYKQPQNQSSLGSDLYRIIAALDNTEVYVNGNLFVVLDRGQVIEDEIRSALNIEATGPILVAEFKKTSQESQSNRLGDPFMMIVPPKEQFMTNYSVINTQAYENQTSGSPSPVYQEHYIAIVAIDSTKNKINIDGNPISAILFNKINTSSYSYANVEVSEGAHTISSPSKIGVYVYGYGRANSYGYTGGMMLKILDTQPPSIVDYDTCFNIGGTFYDTTRYDSKIMSVVAPADSSYNTKIDIEKFTPPFDSVRFSASLIDKYDDGYFVITAIDSLGLGTIKFYQIPGFTIALENQFSDTNIINFQKMYRVNTKYCEMFTLENYGNFDHTINSLLLKHNSNLQINLQAPFNIKSKEKIPFEICFEFDKDTTITDTLIIYDACGNREILALNLIFITDREIPKITVSSDLCKEKFNILISDSLAFDTGIKTILITDTSNCKVSYTNIASDVSEINIDVINPYHDAYYTVFVEDSIGNTNVYNDTIPGFTIDFPQFVTQTNIIDYGLKKIGSIYCDTLQFHNYGNFPIVFENAYLNNNIRYSIPQIQFPYTINPGEFKNLSICYQPIETFGIPDIDTLNIYFNCLSMKVALTGLGDTLQHIGISDCDVPIKFTAESIIPDYYIDDDNQNIVNSYGAINFGINKSTNITISVYDLLGNIKNTMDIGTKKKGNYKINYDVSNLSNGIYILKINFGNAFITKKIIVLK